MNTQTEINKQNQFNEQVAELTKQIKETLSRFNGLPENDTDSDPDDLRITLTALDAQMKYNLELLKYIEARDQYDAIIKPETLTAENLTAA